MTRKYIEVLDLPGKLCVDCGEIITNPKGYMHEEPAWEYIIHETPRDCIIFLKQRIVKLEVAVGL